MKSLLVALLCAVFSASLSFAAVGPEFVGAWRCGIMNVQISHNSGDQYFVTVAMQKAPAFLRNGMLQLVDGNLLIIDNQTGNLNFGGQDCERAVAVEARERKEEEARKAEQARKLKAAGFIALSAIDDWAEAKAFCRQQGGRLPRINDSDSWAGHPPDYWGNYAGGFADGSDANVKIDGFGTFSSPWPSELPDYGIRYWTDTKSPGNRPYRIYHSSSNILAHDNIAGHGAAVCVP